MCACMHVYLTANNAPFVALSFEILIMGLVILHYILFLNTLLYDLN